MGDDFRDSIGNLRSFSEADRKSHMAQHSRKGGGKGCRRDVNIELATSLKIWHRDARDGTQ